MKIAIDISKDRYDEIMSMDWKNCRLIFDEELRAIHDGKALEQEPCADAISRQAVAEVLLKYAHSAEGKAFAEFLISQINALPPITPQYTDAEIQKMQDLESVEIQTAYELGKAEGSSEKPNKRIHHKSEARRWKRRYLDLKQRIFKLEERTKWIPVLERLPEIHNYMQEYIVTIKWNFIRTAFFTETNGKSWWSIDDVIAWMPLPEPYKASPTGAEEENE